METSSKVTRARSRNLVIRLHPEEREELDAISKAHRLNASDMLRQLIRREFLAMKVAPLSKKKNA